MNRPILNEYEQEKIEELMEDVLFLLNGKPTFRVLSVLINLFLIACEKEGIGRDQIIQLLDME